MLGSEATRFKNLIIAALESSIPSSILTSMICAPLSTCCCAISRAASKLSSFIRRANLAEPVTFVRSPTLINRLSLLLKERKNSPNSNSYTSQLFTEGVEKIIAKIKSDDDCGRKFFWTLFPGPKPLTPPVAIAILAFSIW